MALKVTTGDDESFLVTLKRNGSTFTIDPGATVRAALVHKKYKSCSSAVACSSGATGADWANSLVAVEFASSVTANCPPGDSELELEVDDGGKSTYFHWPVTVKKGLIT